MYWLLLIPFVLLWLLITAFFVKFMAVVEERPVRWYQFFGLIFEWPFMAIGLMTTPHHIRCYSDED